MDVEHLVLDGASTDGTVEIVQRNSDKVAHFVSEKDNGIYSAMNKGLQMFWSEFYKPLKKTTLRRVTAIWWCCFEEQNAR